MLVAALVAGGALAFSPATAAPAHAADDVTAEVPVEEGSALGAITDVTETDGAVVFETESGGSIRATFLDERTVRVEADPTGEFTDPANSPSGNPTETADIIVGDESFTGADTTVSEGETITVSTDSVVLEIERDSGLMSLLRADGSVVWEESEPLSFGSRSTTQHLQARDGEQFLGGGMQNGRSIHTGSVVNIARNFNWEDDGYPNAVPYYMSSEGYGVLRNTFDRGTYDFTADPTTTHEEKRFDAYYFVGDYKQSLDGYTQLTGRPMMPPVYALEYGDADCYNRSSSTYEGQPVEGKMNTIDAVDMAKQFVDNDMPAGWMLVNDGYGCEYTQLPETVEGIKEHGLQTGLWTQRALTEQEYEVGEAGVSMRKLDVAWVGNGYRMALTGCEAAHSGIEQYSDARGTSLMVEGWAGSQRCGMQWTGDHAGNLDAVRWQVSALTGAGNSGMPFTTGDVDGIFGGSTTSYVRDLQWKAFAPALYSMSGWAGVDKRPWLYGDEATEINRKYLQLRQQLMPYIYTLAADAHATGTPMMRSIALEYPNDPMAYGAEANNEFLLGTDFLVAPVFTDSSVRNDIYLPEGQWVDYWTGEIHEGGRVLNGYEAPLDTLPVLVRAGAVVPQGPIARNASLVAADAPITLDVYPQGESSFELYEDDQVTREYQNGVTSAQQFTVTAPEQNAGDVTVTIGERAGEFAGKADSRPYALQVHTGSSPAAVTQDGVEIPAVADAAALEAAGTGWYFDADAAGGTIFVKADAVASSASSVIALTGTSAVGGNDIDAASLTVDVLLDDKVAQGDMTVARVTATNSGDRAKSDVAVSLGLASGWEIVDADNAEIAELAAGASATASFTIRPTDQAAAGGATVRAAVTYTAASGESVEKKAANQIYVVYGSLAGAYNHVSVTSLETRELGDFDGGGATFSAEALAAVGVTPGSTVNVALPGGDVDFTWPDYEHGKPNAVALDGQTIALDGKGSHLAVLTSAAAGGGTSPNLTIQYTDGTTQTESLFVPNWLKTDTGSATVAIEPKGRNNRNSETLEYGDYVYAVYANTVRLNPGKTVAAVILPVATNVKFFDWQVVEQEMPEAPVGTVHVSDLEWIDATNGWGVIGKDVANKDAANSPDVPLIINTTDELKKTYDKGLGVHATSKITYYLGGQCTTFTSDAGLEDGFAGKVIFRVDVDGAQKYQGKTFTGGMLTEQITVDVRGAQYLELKVDPTDDGAINGAHGVWGQPMLVCADGEPGEPGEPEDTTAPVTIAELSGTANGAGWYNERPSLTLSATDDVEVQVTQFRLGDGAWNTYTEPVLLPEGETVVSYRSIDTSSNVEDDHVIEAVRVDTAPPSVTVAVDERSFVVEAEDALSGVAGIEFSLDGGTSWAAYEAPVAVGDEGGSIIARASDVAGNISAATDAVVIDAVGGTDPEPEPEPTTPSIVASPEARPGEEIVVRFSGFGADVAGEVWLHSDPVLLGEFAVDGEGEAVARFRIPADAEAGAHTLRVLVDGEVLASTVLIVVAADDEPIVVPGVDPSRDGLAATGMATGPVVITGAIALLLIVGGALVLWMRRARGLRADDEGGAAPSA
ncbi:NPCBM/NEW2 domain-containing protein [uncultured Microbacterium sp.]|uniref:NPCBM/NEW2 domain-containing protein n=1 Tax=uncultured Microbacterium sp. TaxID=191216 RepID=UPI002626E047|nr:NPCBM/NEW2 domain-containing protein [uncultured Microbacterium sp.]